jgi:hypothetical protein
MVAKDLLALFSLLLIVLILAKPAKEREIQELPKLKHKRLSKHLQNFAGKKSPKGLGTGLGK